MNGPFALPGIDRKCPSQHVHPVADIGDPDAVARQLFGVIAFPVVFHGKDDLILVLHELYAQERGFRML